MTKQEFLSKLSEEELHILRDIMSCEITRELDKRNPKTPIEVKVGDCFVYRNFHDTIYLTKVICCNPEDSQSDEYFDCKKICITSSNINVYKMDCYLSEFSKCDRIDSEIFDNIAALVNNRDNTINKIRKEFDEQIRELCSTSLNTQNKN